MDLPPLPWEWETLSASEQARANRFKRSIDRQRYCVVRSTLRQLLAHYLDQLPSEISISYGRKGKPWIQTPTEYPVLHFNLSHSQNMALFGFRRGYELGVDIESIHSSVQALSIARRFFTPKECEFLQHHGESFQSEIFFQLWTRKESCIKAIGDSLFERISTLEVPLKLDCSGQWESLSDQSLHVRDVHLDKNYKAAVATTSPPKTLICREWCQAEMKPRTTSDEEQHKAE